MVFPGRLSTGCYLCRKRKVKCDDTKPACRRCITHGTECPGYPDAFSFRSYKSGALEDRPRSCHKTDIKTDIWPPKRKDALKIANQSIRPPPGICVEWQAICHFFHHYVLQVEKSPCRGHLVFLPELYQERGSDQCLKNALLSVSYLALFKSTGAHAIRVNAYNHYGSALKGLARALNSSKAATKEETLAISLFLSMFKDLSDERNDLYNPHVPGIHSLLQSWGESQLNTKYGREVFGWALTHIQIQAIATNQFHYASLPSSIESMHDPDTVYLAGIITSKISEFCKSTNAIRQSTLLCNSGTDGAFEGQILSLFDDASNILHIIKQWNSSIPRHWKQQTVTSNSPNNVMATTVSETTQDPWTTCFLAVFYSSQIYFHLEIMNLIVASDQFNTLVQTHLTDIVAGPGDHIHYLIGRICYTVTRTLGTVDENGQFKMLGEGKMASGYTMTWPLWMVINCGFAAPTEIELCRKALTSIGSTMRFDLASFLSMTTDQP